MQKITVTLPEDLVKDVDDLSDECETTRTEIIEEILTYVMDKDELIDEIFGEAEEEESEEEDEEEEE